MHLQGLVGQKEPADGRQEKRKPTTQTQELYVTFQLHMFAHHGVSEGTRWKCLCPSLFLSFVPLKRTTGLQTGQGHQVPPCFTEAADSFVRDSVLPKHTQWKRQRSIRYPGVSGRTSAHGRTHGSVLCNTSSISCVLHPPPVTGATPLSNSFQPQSGFQLGGSSMRHE